MEKPCFLNGSELGKALGQQRDRTVAIGVPTIERAKTLGWSGKVRSMRDRAGLRE